MKFNLLLFLLTALLLISCAEHEEINEELVDPLVSNEVLNSSRWTDPPTIVFGTRSRPCGGDGDCYCEGDKGICLLINPIVIGPDDIETYNISDNSGIGTFELISASEIKISMLRENSDASQEEKVFHILEDLTITDVFEKEVTLLKGEYDISFEENELGDIIVNYEI